MSGLKTKYIVSLFYKSGHDRPPKTKILSAEKQNENLNRKINQIMDLQKRYTLFLYIKAKLQHFKQSIKNIRKDEIYLHAARKIVN